MLCECRTLRSNPGRAAAGSCRCRSRLRETGGHYGDDLDVASAHERFAGTSREEACRRFGHGDIIGAVDELRWMPPVPFRFYLLALCDYLRTRDVLADDRDAASAASSFLNLVEQKLKLAPEHIAPVLGEVMPVVEYVAGHQKRFQAPIKIYGSFGTAVRRLRALAKKAGSRDECSSK